MSIKESLSGVSRRSFLKVAGTASALAVAAPVGIAVERRSRERHIEARIRQFLADELNNSRHFVWPEPGTQSGGHFLTEQANNVLRYSPLNASHQFDQVRLFDTPLVAFASARDPLFLELKRPEVVGPNHLSPEEWLPGAKTVISVFYPFSEEVRASNRAGGLPSLTWLAAKASAELYLCEVAHGLVKFLAGLGASAVAGGTDARFAIVRSGGLTIPNWSERHAGYVAGLGTFGLHKSLITEKGSAGRLTSVITDLELAPSTRPYQDKNAYCPYYVNGSCDVCVGRCPGHAVSKTGNEQASQCAKYCKDNVVPSIAPLPYKGGCGKCLTGLPCEIQIPASIKRTV